MSAVTASVLAISMVPRQGDNLIRLFSASQREGMEGDRERGPAFLILSSFLKLLLIKQSETTEAGPAGIRAGITGSFQTTRLV